MPTDPPDFLLLGPLEIRRAGRPVAHGIRTRSKEARLLAVLLRRPGELVRADDVVTRVWDTPISTASRDTCVTNLRRELGGLGLALPRTGDGYRLDVPRGSVDIHRFESLVDSADEQLGRDPRQAMALLREAVDLWRGTALLALKSRWLDDWRSRLEQRRLTARVTLARLEYADRPSDAHAAEIAALHADHPADEDAAMLAMVVLAGRGDRNRALGVFRRAEQALRDELDVAPSDALIGLRDEIAEHRPGAAARRAIPGAVPSGIPRQLPAQLPTFSGREAPLARLNQVLDSAAPARIVVIDGAAGVGKTALAVFWAHRIADRFPDGVLWLDLQGFTSSGTPMGWPEALRHLLVGLGAGNRQVAVDETQRLNDYRTRTAASRLLVLLDNAASAEQVRPLVPAGLSSLVLVTSRRQLPGLQVSDGAVALSLEVPGEQEARRMLAAQVDGDRVAAEPVAAAQLVQLCGKLPLALAIVGARAAAQPDLPLSDLLRQFPPGLDAFETGDAATSPRAVFDWSVRKLTTDDQRTLSLLGAHPGPSFDVEAVTSLCGTDPRTARAGLGRLSAVRLLTQRRDGRYVFHDLIQDYAAELFAATSPELRSEAVRRLFDHYLIAADACATELRSRRQPLPLDPPAPGVAAVAVTGDAEARSWLTAEYQVLLRLIGTAGDRGLPGHSWRILTTMADYFDWQGLWDDWIVASRAAIAIAESADDLPGIARARRCLGRAFAQLRKWADADDELRSALELYRVLGDLDGQIRLHHDLGALLDQQELYPAALAEVEQSLRLSEQAGGSPELANILGAIAWCHVQLRQYEAAASYSERAIAAHRAENYPRGEAAALDTLGVVQGALGRFAAALTSLDRARALCEQVGDLLGTAMVNDHLGDCQLLAGQPAAAIEAWTRAADQLQNLRHPAEAGVRQKIAEAVVAAGPG